MGLFGRISHCSRMTVHWSRTLAVTTQDITASLAKSSPPPAVWSLFLPFSISLPCPYLLLPFYTQFPFLTFAFPAWSSLANKFSNPNAHPIPPSNFIHLDHQSYLLSSSEVVPSLVTTPTNCQSLTLIDSFCISTCYWYIHITVPTQSYHN